jgi:hypothetical protein
MPQLNLTIGAAIPHERVVAIPLIEITGPKTNGSALSVQLTHSATFDRAHYLRLIDYTS